MRRLALVGLLYLLGTVGAGILVGCGDNQPKAAADSGMADADGATDRAEGGGEVGDARTDGSGDAAVCPAVSFTAPMDNTLLTVADDSSPAGGDACMNGFQYTVRVAVGAANGIGVELLGTMGSTTIVIATSTVMTGVVQFTNATLAQGTTTLKVRIGGVNGTICMGTALVTVDCSLPIVTVIAPQPDSAPFSDVTKRLLAATATQALKDQSPTTAGAQTDVVACSNRLGSAKLYVRQMGDTARAQVGSAANTVPAVPADNCPTGLSFVVKFSGVTIPDSTENTDGTLSKATELIVDVTDAAAATVTGSSDPVDLWVDSTPPTISEMTPTPLCGSTQNVPAMFTTNVALNSDASNVTLAVTNTSTSPNPVPFGPPTYAPGVATFTAVTFPPGQNTLAATATEPSGNSTRLVQMGMTTCTVNVGTFPVVTFVTPTSGGKLCAIGNSASGCLPDSNLGTPGWQNDVVVHVTAGGAPLTTGLITFTINGGVAQTAPLDSSGNATLSGQTVPEGNGIVLAAATGNVPIFGVGMSSIAVNVDTLPPAAVTGLLATVLDRRQTSFTLTWTAPSDAGGGAITGYDIHVKRNDPVTMSPCSVEVETVPFLGTVADPTLMQTLNVPSLSIETNYCFTVVSLDLIGNPGPLAMASAVARFNLTVLNPVSGGLATERFGYSRDGSGDHNGDGISDLSVGTFGAAKAYLFLGVAGSAPTVPTTVFTGSGADTLFGLEVANVGDIDGDTLADLAISSPTAGKVFIYKGRATWPSTLTEANADYIINADITVNVGYAGSLFGFSVAPLGKFDGDDGNDFAIGAYRYGTGQPGRVVIVRGKTTGFASITLPDAVNTITIDGDPTLASEFFGYKVLGLGRLYATGGNTLVVSAIGSVGLNSSNGRVYAFHGQAGTAGSIPLSSADNMIVGPAANARIGFALTNLGPIISSLPGLGIAAPFYNTTVPAAFGHAFLYAGDATLGPFAGSSWDIYDSAATGTTDAFGSVLFGGGFSGSNLGVSLIGNSTSDVAVIPAKEAGGLASIYIVDGSALAGRASPLNIASAGDVKVVLPAGWAGTSTTGRGLIRDINGDGYGDFAVGENAPTIMGRVALFW